MRRGRLAAVSALQLCTGLAGVVLAVRRGHAFDVFGIRGRPETVLRDAAITGTALSAPGPMLLTQAVCVAAVANGPAPRAGRTLGWLGAAMTGGYLAERLVRSRLTPAGWDAVESPVIVAGIGLSAGMALLGLRPSDPTAA